ncbi:ATP-dependent helicase HrpB [Leadbettera azotonutricia]|uniref:ATP-dependent helicase HrpB n=1 Tax=Leadbettera azotonutricia (strain ATCC BAA-888 / DSM 13862 / ZAS-9) TaxID=545695 RepID=F5YBK9_LEAAZ|nr:ATP-dependent helicase HrpB [Leadbettera azotonutricia]AEF82785.1 ATP-dependent helicase HrpB [Leadbettera azotonutricia ZAS-9]
MQGSTEIKAINSEAESLPLYQHLDAICAAMAAYSAAIVRSDPGSGKSTLVPLALLNHFEERGDHGRIIMLEPRRAAAAGLAARMADLIGEELGSTVGYRVRLERKVSKDTRIEVLTEGLFLRHIQSDPSLNGVSAVVFDEFHERSVFTDLALALVADLRRMGSKVKILVMSATMDAQKAAAFLGDVLYPEGDQKIPIIDVPGKVFPVETEYRPLPQKTYLGKEVGAALCDIFQNRDGEGDALVFLPGKREIADAEAALVRAGLGENFEILALHGSLPLREQRKIISPGQADKAGRDKSGQKKSRIILSTNLAETSLTIPGISLVIDSGFVRLERFHIPTAMNRLSLEACSLQSADQRRGRAGRLGPGSCIRLWNKNDPRPVETEPEICRTDLSNLVLECLLWGASGPDSLGWLEAPLASSWEKALENLVRLGCAQPNTGTGGVKITSKGRLVTQLGLDPRLGCLCIAGKEKGSVDLACASAALLTDRDNSGIKGDGDFRNRLAELRNNPYSPWTRTIAENAGDLKRRLKEDSKIAFSWTAGEEADAGELLAHAFPDRIAQRQENDAGINGKFRFVSGREGIIEGALKNSEWIVAAEADAGERSAAIRLAAPVSNDTALSLLKSDLATELSVEWKGLIPRTMARRKAGRLVISEEKRISTREEAQADLGRLLAEKGLEILPWDEGKGEARNLLSRIRFFAQKADLPNIAMDPSFWTEEALIQDAPAWLGPFIWEGKKQDSAAVFSNSSLKNALQTRLGWGLSPLLEKQVPETFVLPNARPRHIDYSSGKPEIRARLQDCFGIKTHPAILGTPLVFQLLSPADRPIQITSDLPSFWKGSYADVRKDMRGRYPKHKWPENPV